MRMAHQDEFLQMIETSAVRKTVENYKHEKLLCKDKIDGIDALADASLYDLKVLHNGAQRAKSRPGSAGSSRVGGGGYGQSGPPSRPGSACSRGNLNQKQSMDTMATDQLRSLCTEMRTDLRKNCANLGSLNMNAKAVSYLKTREENRILEELQAYIRPIEDEEVKKKRMRQELLAGFGGMFNKVNKEYRADEASDEVATVEKENLPAPVVEPIAEPPKLVPAQRVATQRLAELVGFLLGCCGSLDDVFREFDSDNNRVLSLEEWETGMRKLGFQDDVSYVFRLLGKGRDGAATLHEVEALFDPFLKRAP